MRQSEEKFRQLADSIPQLTWMARSDGHIFWYNQRWYDYTGTTPEQMEGWGWQSVHDPDVLPAGPRPLAQVDRQRPSRSKWSSRSAVPTASFASSLPASCRSLDADGRVLYWFGTNTDIDEQTRAEERIKASERLYRAIGESIPFGVWTCDAEGRNTYASDSFLQLVGLTQEQCSEFGWGDVLHPDDVRADHRGLEGMRADRGKLGHRAPLPSGPTASGIPSSPAASPCATTRVESSPGPGSTSISAD